MKAHCPRCGNELEAIGSATVRTAEYTIDEDGHVEGFDRRSVEVFQDCLFDDPSWNCPICMIVLDDENEEPFCSKKEIVAFLENYHRNGDRPARVTFTGEFVWFEVPDAIGFEALTADEFDEGSLTRNLLEALERMTREED